MSTRTLTDSICSLSWIDKRTGLREQDGAGPPSIIHGYQVTREDDALPFRFLNLLEATILVDESRSPRIVSSNWTSASKIYQNPSYGKINSEAFPTKQSILPSPDRVVFRQTVGARTVSPEVIAQTVGAGGGIVTGVPFADKIARKVAHEFFGYPPIWTTLQLTLFADGRSEGAVLCHSLFPSMNFYARPRGSANAPLVTSRYSLVGPPYDALQHLDEWQSRGWGPPQNKSGPCEGNPWGLKKTDLTVRPVDPGRRTV